MKTAVIVIAAVIAVLVLFVGLGWLGLQIRPRPFAPFPQVTPPLDTVPLPDGLPTPVSRFYKAITGERTPVIDSAVITGRGKLRFAGINFPARLRFTHDAGQGYRHYIEATLFGYPVFKVNEWYVEGESRLELPVGVVENEPKVNQAANMGLWGESMWLPSVFVTDPRVRWEGIDETTARLVVPFGGGEDTFTVEFDPQTGLIRSMESLRYKQATDEAKTRSLFEVSEWDTMAGAMIPSLASVTWEDEGTPWLTFEVDEIVYNVDIEEYIRARGP